MDIELGNEDGMSVTSQIRGLEKKIADTEVGFKPAYIIALSGHDEEIKE
jgi:CheY-like chemotaxis protein